LIRKNTFYCCYGVFKVRASRAREKAARPNATGPNAMSTVAVSQSSTA